NLPRPHLVSHTDPPTPNTIPDLRDLAKLSIDKLLPEVQRLHSLESSRSESTLQFETAIMGRLGRPSILHATNSPASTHILYHLNSPRCQDSDTESCTVHSCPDRRAQPSSRR